VLLRKQEPRAHEHSIAALGSCLCGSAAWFNEKDPGIDRGLPSCRGDKRDQASSPMTDFFSMNSSRPNLPNSRPLPDCL